MLLIFSEYQNNHYHENVKFQLISLQSNLNLEPSLKEYTKKVVSTGI